VKFEEFKQQFQLTRREAQQEHDELSTESEAILKEYKSLVELSELFVADVNAGSWGVFAEAK